MALNKVSDMSAADWLSQTHVKNNENFSRVVIRFFSVVEIPINYSSLYNERIYLITVLRLKFPKFEEYVKNVPEAEIFFRIYFGSRRSVKHDKIYPGEKVRHTVLHNLRTVIRFFQHQIGRKTILQPGPEKHYS